MPSLTGELGGACSLRGNEERECTDTPSPVRRYMRRDVEKVDARCCGVVLAFLVLALPLASVPALAQLAQKPMQIIVPFAPGASADGAARIVANELGPRLGRQVVVEHRAGAGGVLGLQMLAKSQPDGDTLGVGATGALLLNPNLPNNPGPDLLRELAPVAKLIEVALVLVANPSTGPKSIADMVERSKATPGGLTYGSTGTNSSQHLSVELLKRATGANLVHVPYRGSAPAVVDVIAGQIPLASVDLTSAYPHIQAGRLRALGLIDGKRFAAAPEIATIAETVPNFGRASGFIGLFAPAGTPAPIIKKISQEVAGILARRGAQASARTLTAVIAYEDDKTFASFLAGESLKWKQALASLDLRQ
jgi:tripartite-type tricarboxylate transporter receptor subunit TctC